MKILLNYSNQKFVIRKTFSNFKCTSERFEELLKSVLRSTHIYTKCQWRSSILSNHLRRIPLNIMPQMQLLLDCFLFRQLSQIIGLLLILVESDKFKSISGLRCTRHDTHCINMWTQKNGIRESISRTDAYISSTSEMFNRKHFSVFRKSPQHFTSGAHIKRFRKKFLKTY